MSQTAPPDGGATDKSVKGESFERNLERLDAIVRDLEDAELSLERALELYEEGMRLAGTCQQQLEAAEGRIEILRERGGGKIVAEPFEDDEPKP